jgi:hypothetical protein
VVGIQKARRVVEKLYILERDYMSRDQITEDGLGRAAYSNGDNRHVVRGLGSVCLLRMIAGTRLHDDR